MNATAVARASEQNTAQLRATARELAQLLDLDTAGLDAVRVVERYPDQWQLHVRQQVQLLMAAAVEKLRATPAPVELAATGAPAEVPAAPPRPPRPSRSGRGVAGG